METLYPTKELPAHSRVLMADELPGERQVPSQKHARHEDSLLIEKAKHNGAHFSLLYNKYRTHIFRYFWYRVGNDREMAEDLTQSTFMHAYARLPFFQINGYSYRTYLYTIAHNSLVNYYRKKKTLPLEFAEQIASSSSQSFVQEIALSEGLWGAVKELKCDDTDAFSYILKHLESIPLKDIAQKTGRSVNAVKLRLSRARRRLSIHPWFAALSGEPS